MPSKTAMAKSNFNQQDAETETENVTHTKRGDESKEEVPGTTKRTEGKTASAAAIEMTSLDTREADFAIPAHKLDHPLQFDMSKILVFKMPEITSVQMYDKIDE